MNDFKHAFRQLAKTPSVTLLAVLSLAVGIGINSTIFSAMDAAFLRPLPVKNPDEIVRLDHPWLSLTEYRQLRDGTKLLGHVAASRFMNCLLKGREQTELVHGRAVSSNYFTTLGTTAVAGQLFTARSPNLAEGIVVLSHALWSRRFGADPAILGQTIVLNGQSFTVVGVTARGFVGEDRLPPTELWFPLDSQAEHFATNRRELMIMGRLASGATVEQARTELELLVPRIAPDAPPTSWGRRVLVYSEEESRMDHGGKLAYLMGPIVGLVLLVACANVSCLLLGRYEERRREIAVRLALGASRWRVMRYLLAEASLLSLGGAMGGLLLAAWGSATIPSLLPPMLASWAPEPHIDQRVLELTAGLALFATLAFGLMPAWRASRLDVSAMLKADGAVHLGKTPSRNVLVVAQVMIAMVFLALAALFVRGFWNGMTRDFGFSERNLLLTYLVQERDSTYASLIDEARQTVSALPGVRSVTAANTLVGGGAVPVLGPEDARTGRTAGRPFPCNFVDADYFATLGIPLLNGREFTVHDTRGGSPVAIVSESMAKQFWPGENPVGKTLFAGLRGLQPREVVGVVRDVTDFNQHRETEPMFYLSLRQENARDLMLIVKTAKSPAALAGPMRDALRRMETPATAMMTDTANGRIRAALLPQWFGAWLGGALGLLAFVLAISGLYGVIAYAVSRRTRELGIRIALGAAPRDAVWLVLRQGVTLAAIGVAIAIPIAIGAGTLLQSLLEGIQPTDPLALVGASGLVLGVAVLASYLPARKAARVDPIVALRAE